MLLLFSSQKSSIFHVFQSINLMNLVDIYTVLHLQSSHCWNSSWVALSFRITPINYCEDKKWIFCFQQLNNFFKFFVEKENWWWIWKRRDGKLKEIFYKLSKMKMKTRDGKQNIFCDKTGPTMSELVLTMQASNNRFVHIGKLYVVNNVMIHDHVTYVVFLPLQFSSYCNFCCYLELFAIFLLLCWKLYHEQ